MARTKQTHVRVPDENQRSSIEHGAAWGKILSKGNVVEAETYYAHKRAEGKKVQKKADKAQLVSEKAQARAAKAEETARAAEANANSVQSQKEAKAERKLADKEANKAATKKRTAIAEAKTASEHLMRVAEMGADIERIKRKNSPNPLAIYVDPKEVKRLLRYAEDLEHLAQIRQKSL